ncbi:MAG: hypothetical protein IIX86_00840 [Clostridia bacterium]|nr:hypothetical protein [Clostridia bacterium]
MKFSKILALCLIALLTIAAFVACDEGNKNEQTTEQNTQAPTENTTDSTDTPTTEEPTTEEPSTDAPSTEDVTTEPGEDTTAPGEDTTAPETSTEENTTEPEEESSAPEEDEIKVITIAEALALCGEEGNVTEERYYIRATVKTIVNATYGQMIITDATGEISVYGTYSEDGELNYSQLDDKPYKGDEVLLYCILQNYNGTKEVKNARLIEFTHVEVEIDLNAYTDMSVADAREAAKGTKIKVDGVVAQITYANGFKPNGLFLVDETGSIYVFDGDLAQRVSEGDKITIAGEKDDWILETEQGFAQSFGYKGSCQIASAVLIELDDSQDYAYDKSWITESTVKDILDTPVTENITTNIYKVNALVKKVPGNGFVNYYFFDIDGETGNYTYSQCNGNDFDWLDAFDGKICTVYLSPINCKSTAGACFFRLVPIEVIDEGYTFDTTKAPEYAIKYHALGQFGTDYSADPALELITSVSSELLGFEGVTLSYASSNESVIYFETVDGKVIMHCVAEEITTVTVTVTATYGELRATGTVDITVSPVPTIEHGNVLDAINAAKGETVTIKGIVGPSLVNKVGFYLIDETGVIAVQTTSEVMSTLHIGDEVILTGVRHINIKDTTNHCIGQTCLQDAVILSNTYGSHAYSTATFVTDKTLAEVRALDPMIDYSTTVFVLNVTVTVEETKFYTNIYLTDASGNQLRLYSSSANQYNWLKAYAGQEITVEVAACNWNDKDYYTGCVLSVVTENGKVFNELNFGK